MSEQTANNLKINRAVTTIASFLFVALLTIALTTSLTLAAFGDTSSDSGGIIFGTIDIDDITNSYTIKNLQGGTLSSMSPGDEADVNFALENTGTADLYMRFKIVIQDEDTVTPLDASLFSVALFSAKYTKTVGGTPTDFDAEYIPLDFDQLLQTPTGTPDIWLVRKIKLIGNLNTLTNDPADLVTIRVTFPGAMPTAWIEKFESEAEAQAAFNEFKNARFRVYLYVKTVQVANNPPGEGTAYSDPADPDNYNIIWV